MRLNVSQSQQILVVQFINERWLTSGINLSLDSKD